MGLPQSHWQDAYPVLYSSGFQGSATTTVIGSSVAGKKLRILACHIEAGTAGLITLKDGTGTAIFNLVYCGAGVPQHFSYCPVGWGEGATGAELQLETDATAVVSYTLVYCKV